MRWPIRNQVFVPFAVILLVAVAATALTAAYLAARRIEQTTVAQLGEVIDTLGRSNFPYSENVLLQMKGFSGAEFVALDNDNSVVYSTLPNLEISDRFLDNLPPSDDLDTLPQHPAVELEGRRYLAATVSRPAAVRANRLIVLYPETSLQLARREAALPPLIVGAVTIVLMIVTAAWLANRLSSRIRSVQRQVAEIAAGHFTTVEATGPVDEVRELIGSVNTMSARLEEMQSRIANAERARLLGQLAGGLAHQLRNAVTGARMAVQIHQRRCSTARDDSLDVALRQLRLTEEQVKGLLSLGKSERRAPVACELTDLIEDVASLVGPACEHAEVSFAHHAVTDAGCRLADSEGMRTAILNLTLNAIEAAGPGGRVELEGYIDGGNIAVDVIDTGPGPPAELADNMFDVLVTGKPEGVGFGLALAKQLSDEQGGTLSWERIDGRTRFRLVIPAADTPLVERPQTNRVTTPT